MTATLASSAPDREALRRALGPAISVRDVTKTFRLPHEKYTTVRQRVLRPTRSRSYEVMEALQGVSFDVAEGEFLGVVGRNGSGKSTLLRCLSGIYRIDGGRLDVRGRVAPFIELGVGFNAELTARDNVVINAVMLGMSPRQARARFDDILAFAELEDFVDLKLMNYSSGMILRLAFAVTVEIEADVLLFDEVLAVGDVAFQDKCMRRFQALKDDGRTLLLVTHDMGLVERFCDRALLLESGKVAAIDEPAAIARAYREVNAQSAARSEALPAGMSGRRGAEIRDAWFEDRSGRRVQSLAQGERCWACVEVSVNDSLSDPVFELAVRNGAHQPVFATSSRWAHGATGSFGSGETALLRVSFDNFLAPGAYTVSASVSGQAGAVIDERPELAMLNVYGTRASGGTVDLPHDFEVVRR